MKEVNELKSTVLALHEVKRALFKEDNKGKIEQINGLPEYEFPFETSFYTGASLPTGYKIKENSNWKNSKPLYIVHQKILDRELDKLTLLRQRNDVLDKFEKAGSVSSALFNLFLESKPIELGIYLSEDDEGKYRAAVIGVMGNNLEELKHIVLGTSGGKDLSDGIYHTPWKLVKDFVELPYLQKMRVHSKDGKSKVNVLYYKENETFVKLTYVNRLEENSEE